MILDAISKVLADLDEAGEAEFGETWDDRVAEVLDGFPGSYANLTKPDREPIDYGSLAAQAAYLFMYAPRHADFMRQILQRFRQEQTGPIFNPGQLSVTSLGGGPGSELLGLLAYLSEPANGEQVTNVIYFVLDRELAWEHVAVAVADAANCGIAVEVRFIQWDVTDSKSVNSISLKDDDLTIASYFISEICSIQPYDVVRNCLTSLFGTIRNGAFLIYNDSGSYPFYSYFNGRKNAAGYYVERKEFLEEMDSELPHLTGTMSEYEDRFDRAPKLDGYILAKVCQRQTW